VQNDEPSDESEWSQSDCARGGVSGSVLGMTISGWLLVARSLLDGVLVERKGAFKSGAGADEERLKLTAVIGVSNRVTTSGTWSRSNSAIAASNSTPFLPRTSSSAIFLHRLRSFGPTSRTFRLSAVLPLECNGRKAYWGNLRLCSSSATFALECQISFSSGGRFCQVSPMIFDNVLWFVSTSDETCWFLMKDERKRMNAFGGRGMWFSGFFLACPARRGAGDDGSVVGKMVNSTGRSCGEGGSKNVPGVTVGANAIL
jgi:hypothetical protein